MKLRGLAEMARVPMRLVESVARKLGQNRTERFARSQQLCTQ
jgi:hypothetical protein